MAVALLVGSPAVAATCDVNYTGQIDEMWNTAGNWDTNAVPTNAQKACIPGGKGTIVVASGDNLSVLNLTALSGVRVDDGGELTIFDGTAEFSNSVTDLTVAGPAGIFQTIGSGLAIAGQAVINGHLTCRVRLDSGTLSGSGFIGGAFTNVGGTVRPGGAGAVGTLSVGGPYDQQAGGTLEIDLASDLSYDKLTGPSSAHTLVGNIVVTLLGGYTPASGTNFFFITQNATSVTIGAQVSPSSFVVQALPHGAELTFSPAATTTTSTSPTTTTTTTSPTTTSPTTSTSSTTTTTAAARTSTSATTSTSTSTIHAPSTTTTTAPSGCDAPRAATFTSIDCRLDALIAEVTAASDISARFKTLFLKQLGTARDKKKTAEQIAAAGSNRKVLGNLQRARRKVIGFAHRVRGLRGRRGIPPETSTRIATEGDEISADLKTLRALCLKSSVPKCGAP